MPRINSWIYVGVGVVIGLWGGVAVSQITDLPLAPEIGILIGGCVGIVLGNILGRPS
jgi:hypothetical protein